MCLCQCVRVSECLFVFMNENRWQECVCEREKERERVGDNADKILGCHIGLSNSKRKQAKLDQH